MVSITIATLSAEYSEVIPKGLAVEQMTNQVIQKIVSGGQTGVDRAALDVAIFLEIEHGGWCPLGRRAEDGRIPAVYRLKQTRSKQYSARTEQNVVDSDGTCILYRQQTTGGTELTRKLAIKHNRPLICIDLNVAEEKELEELNSWLKNHGIKVLNIAGPRESTCPGIMNQTERFLLKAFSVTD